MFDRPASCARWLAAAAALLLGASTSLARTSIIGGLGNFDVYNECEDECDEFDIELEGPHIEDVYHTYTNGNYGAPTITSLPGNTGIRIVYSHPRHNTYVHGLEHFGVSIKDMSVITAQRFQWVPVNTTPPPPIEMPLISTELVDTVDGPVMRETVINKDSYGRSLWIQRSEVVLVGQVSLEQLMPQDPLIQSATVLDVDTTLLGVNIPLVNDEDAPEPGETHSEIIVYDVYADIRHWNGYEFTHQQGALVGTALVAAVTEGSSCTEAGKPTILSQPVSIEGIYDAKATFLIDVESPDIGGELFYQWRFEGQPIEGEDSAHLKVDVLPETVGSYSCVVTNDCGSVISDAAWLTTKPCPQDFDKSGFVDTDDYDAFILAFEKGNHHADFDRSGFVDTDDFDAFVHAFEQGC